MKLDRVLTVAIGRDNANGPLPDDEWREFRGGLITTISRYATVVAATDGPGVGSDDDRDGQAEDSAVVVAINPKYANRIRSAVAKLLIRYGQSSCAFALDQAHEPVFPTGRGQRLTA